MPDWMNNTLTNALTWIVTGVVGPAIFGAIPKLRKWLLKHHWVAASIIGGSAALIVFGVLWLVMPGTTLPAGMVVAFDGPCPERGWKPFEAASARFIIGAGSSDRYRLYEREL